MKKKAFSILLVLCMVMSMIPSIGLTAFAATATPPTDTWDHHAAESFAGGTGTESDPYQIATAEQLAKLANDVNNIDDSDIFQGYDGRYFVLTADIDLSGYRWIPIGIYADGITNTRFGGCLDGQSHKIIGLYVDERESGLSAGLFGSIGTSADETTLPATVKNLTIEAAEIYASDNGPGEDVECGYVGVLTGMVTPYYPTTRIENVHVSGSINTTSPNDLGVYCGGMIGSGSNLIASNCSTDVEIKGECNVVSGGFIGFCTGNEFENCTAKGSIEGDFSIGGFAGMITFGDDQIADAIIDSKLSKCTASVEIIAQGNIGGFVGVLDDGTISNCAAYGNITSTATEGNLRVGGFTGINMGEITNSHAVGTVTESHENFEAGGFVGCDGRYFDDEEKYRGTTTGCSFDTTKNPKLNAIGFVEVEGTNDITGVPTADVLANICVDVLGGHALTHNAAVDATCTQKGNVEYWNCSVCGNNFDSVTGGKVIDDVVKDINPNNHKPAAGWTQENGKHFHACQNGCAAHLDEADCSGGKATCTDKAKCEVCSKEYGDVLKHDWNDTTYVWSTDGKNCTATRTCKNESTHIETVTAAITGTQTKESTCTEKGETTYTATFSVDWAAQQTKVLADIEATGHSYVHHDEVPATHESDGKAEYYTCYNCDLLFDKDKNVVTAEELVIPKLDNPVDNPADNPASTETGDNSNIWLWIALMGIAGSGIIGTTIYSKKRKEYTK